LCLEQTVQWNRLLAGGERIAARTPGGHLITWDASRVDEFRVLASAADTTYFVDVARSSDGQFLSTKTISGSFTLWKNGKPTALRPRGGPRGSPLAFSADGTRLAACADRVTV
jgi:hypothetical protein